MTPNYPIKLNIKRGKEFWALVFTKSLPTVFPQNTHTYENSVCQVGPWVLSLVPNHSSHTQDTGQKGVFVQNGHQRIAEVAWQTPFTIGSSERLASGTQTQRVDSTRRREGRGQGSRAERERGNDSMGALREERGREEKKDLVAFSWCTSLLPQLLKQEMQSTDETREALWCCQHAK